MSQPIITTHPRPPSLFQPATVQELGSPGYPHTHAQTTGTVEVVRGESDGDVHVRLVDGQNMHFIICEIIPELPLPIPELGEKITVQGIHRYDYEHFWGEIHCVLHWEPAK